MRELLADDYSDRWGHDKVSVVDRTKQVFSQFFAVTIEAQEFDLTEADGIGQVRARLKIKGTGGPLAELVVQKAATLQQPFTFEWRQLSWKPWHWGLAKVDQPELELTEYY